MPQLGESVSEGVVARWLKQVGDRVELDEPLVEVTTDKVNAEIPSMAAGVLSHISVQEGETVGVGVEIAIVDDSGTAGQPSLPVVFETQVQPAPAAPSPTSEPSANGVEEEAEGGRQRLSPLVRRLAQEYAVDLSAVRGSGLNNRVTKDDVLEFVKRREPAPIQRPAAAVSSAPASRPPDVVTHTLWPKQEVRTEDQVLKVTPVRRMIAEHMVRSKTTVPHATTFVEVDMTGLVRRRAEVREGFRQREGVDLTFLPFVVQSAVEALSQFPMLNSEWKGDSILIKHRLNVGVAVSLEESLVVPVIHDAGQLGLSGIARAIRDLSEKARAGKLSLQDVREGTFTVNNPGAFGTVLSLPIINEPQTAMLTMDAIVKRPVVVDGDAIAVHSMMFLGVAFDHRVVDGLMAGRFLAAAKHYLEKVAPTIDL